MGNVSGVETTETELVPVLEETEITVEGFGNNCFVDDALLSCEDRALLLVVDMGVPGRVGDTLPSCPLEEETIGSATIIASSSSSSSFPSSLSLSGLFTSSML